MFVPSATKKKRDVGTWGARFTALMFWLVSFNRYWILGLYYHALMKREQKLTHTE